MSERASHTKIGAFVVFGILLLATGLAVFGSGLLQRGGIVAETYFPESVLGLNLGAAVYERGVKVGEVIDIDFVRLVYEIPPDDPRFDKAGSWVVVRFRLRPPRESYLGTASAEEAARLIAQQVERGLRVQLASSVVTQVAYLEISYQAAGRPPPPAPLAPEGWQPAYAYIPSTPSTLARIGDAAEHVFARLDALDIEGLMTDLHAALTTATRKLEEAKVAELSQEASGLLRELRETNRRAQAALAELDTREVGEGLQASFGRLQRTLERADALLGSADGAVRSSSAQLMALLSELRESVAALDDVLGDARDNPSLLLLGAPPEPIELPRPE